MPMPKKPDELKKKGVSVGLPAILIQALDDELAPGQSRSAYVADLLAKHLKSQVKKLEKQLKN